MGITGVLKVTQCSHVTVKTFAWIENLPGKPPSFVYEGFPGAGLVALSKNEIVVLCKRCAYNYNPNLIFTLPITPEKASLDG